MTNTPSAQLAGALSRIAAAGLTARQIDVETPDGTPMTLTFIDAGRPRAPSLKCGVEADQGEPIGERADRAKSPGKWARLACR
jgi:hypothetical protein